MLSLNETFSIENLGFLFTDLKGSTEMYERLGDAQKRIGDAVHHRPCIAVTLNERIDYFGTTVNIAARVQGLPDGRDVMATGKIFSEGDAADYLRQKGWLSEPFTTSLRGLKSSYEVHKLQSPRASG